MTANTSLERRVAEHYASEPPLRAPDRVLHAALATIDTTPQRRGVFAPWRFAYMNAYAKVAAAAVVAIAVAAIGLWQFGGIGNPRPGPTPGPSPTPGASPTVAPSASLAPDPTQPFTSNMHGVSMSHPAGWAVTEATTPWTTPDLPGFGDTSADLISDSVLQDHLFMVIASQPLAGVAGPAWADTVGLTEPCPTSERITVDGAEGRLITCNPMRALFWTDDRGYLILLYRSSDEPWLDDAYTTEWFQEVLATVQILPPVSGTADMFVRPFDYVLPGAPVFDYGTTNASYWEVRVPAYNDAGAPGGLIVQAIGGGRADPCNAESAVVPLDSGPDSVIQYLRTIPELTVTDASDTTVDGRPARQATVTATGGGADCAALWLWGEQTESFITDLELRLVVVDVDGEHIVVTIFGEPENPELPALADGIIGSFDFATTE
jgi:hypothetical protein